MNVSASARIIAAALNTVSTSREMPHEFRYHAKVLNDHLDEVLRSGMFDLSRTRTGSQGRASSWMDFDQAPA